jgi:hypothetical protein
MIKIKKIKLNVNGLKNYFFFFKEKKNHLSQITVAGSISTTQAPMYHSLLAFLLGWMWGRDSPLGGTRILDVKR